MEGKNNEVLNNVERELYNKALVRIPELTIEDFKKLRELVLAPNNSVGIKKFYTYGTDAIFENPLSIEEQKELIN